MPQLTFELAQRNAEQQLNRQAARTCSLKNNAQAIIELTQNGAGNAEVMEQIYLLATAIQYDALDQMHDLNTTANLIADIDQLRISHVK